MYFNKKLYFNLFVFCFILFLNKVRTEENKWLLNKDHQTDFETVGSTVTFKYKPNTSNNYNAMYLGLSANQTNKVYYWEFKCKSKCKVGVAKKDSFADGYSIRGAFFNGNLIDGSSLLIPNFGHSVRKEEERIGFILGLTDKELNIYIVQNDRPLGLAFVQSAPYSTDLHPTIIFSSPGSVEIQEKSTKNLINLLKRDDFSNKEINGHYKLKPSSNSNEVNLPAYQITLSKENDEFHFSTKAVNHLGGRIIKVGSDEKGDVYRIENVSRTTIGAYGEDRKNEDNYFGALFSLERVEFKQDFKELTIKSGSKILNFVRFVPEKEPYITSTLLA